MRNIFIIVSLLALTVTSAHAEQPGSPDDGLKIRKMSEFYFESMDTNHDGIVTRDEARAFADRMFDEANTSHDGKLTIDQLVDQKMRERDAFKIYIGKNTSDTNNDSKLKAN